MSADVDALFGRDIALDERYRPVVTASGDAVLTSGTDMALQEVRLRPFTPLGSPFYDVGYGSRIHRLVYEESTPATRTALEAEAARRIAEDPAVQPLSVRCRVLKWDESRVILEARFLLIGISHPQHLVMNLDLSVLERVMEDVRTD